MLFDRAALKSLQQESGVWTLVHTCGLKSTLRLQRTSGERALALIFCLAFVPQLCAQENPDIRELKLKDWHPRSMMVTKTTVVEKPLFPVIDIHNHLGSGKNFLTPQRVERYLKEMNEAGVRTVVNLDGGWDDQLKETIAALDKAHPGRFLTFALINFEGIDDPGWTVREKRRLEESFAAGARGLKIAKTFGLRYRHNDGRLVNVDDPKLDELWETCGKHKKPVLIHIADPAAFFTPLDSFNERWHELNANPGWLFYGKDFPKREEMLKQLHSVIGRHPNTTFVNTHFGNNAEDLGAVAAALDRYPNMVVDIDARISELGRQPYTTRKFILKYQDRVLFGTDTPPKRDAYRIYYRFLETDDEYFDCAASHHLQGFWMIYGVFLPRDVLEKIYHKNAEKLLGLTDEPVVAATKTKPVLHVPSTDDFKVTGDGSAPAWQKATWQSLQARKKDNHPYEARFKLLYSKTGIYILFDGTDTQLTSTLKEDFTMIWTEDVYEAFFWPDESAGLYFEYEISPLGYELPIIVPNFNGTFMGWLPWFYMDKRRIQKATSVRGGEKKSGATVSGWSAEVFIPYELLKPLQNVPPKPGAQWRANFYRMDYDGGKNSAWDWSRVGPTFHDYTNFGTLIFD
ncbi:MAG TPA: carbohydrate-binding family 9-like protein [Gemmataceae bacterium]|jgi:predicted TIM-barrel fold metal-dependent hydrolase|nr:carbohydrate-binding family 9-like protein [Gemmataceae bacterium]